MRLSRAARESAISYRSRRTCGSPALACGACRYSDGSMSSPPVSTNPPTPSTGRAGGLGVFLVHATARHAANDLRSVSDENERLIHRVAPVAGLDARSVSYTRAGVVRYERGMFDSFRQSLEDLMNRATPPEERREITARMRATLVQAKAAVHEMRDALEKSRARLTLEERE